MDIKRFNQCRVRMRDGRVLLAIWGPHEMQDGRELWCWAASDEGTYELTAVKEFVLLGSMPVGSLPGGFCTDEELIADHTKRRNGPAAGRNPHGLRVISNTEGT
ncbi:hypothetical protein APY04_0769 [Hyphomicrobium sulfonivorans]|uniref:Uncharacterized protein n=2 Tax=Hyphomicrobium sulfonivorans TaxID=121290 RepID=A0A125NVT3_HYPSL|nr:hypothetical protein APY04_0769 [Hyphomicrobium sulfonivorans]